MKVVATATRLPKPDRDVIFWLKASPLHGGLSGWFSEDSDCFYTFGVRSDWGDGLRRVSVVNGLAFPAGEVISWAYTPTNNVV